MEFVKTIGPKVDIWLTLKFFKVLMKLLDSLPGGIEKRAAREEVRVQITEQLKRSIGQTCTTVPADRTSALHGNVLVM